MSDITKSFLQSSGTPFSLIFQDFRDNKPSSPSINNLSKIILIKNRKNKYKISPISPQNPQIEKKSFIFTLTSKLQGQKKTLNRIQYLQQNQNNIMIKEGQQGNLSSQLTMPKETLYVRNLNEKIKPKDMKYCLYNLFESYGQILQIVIKRNNKMRGQGFIVFREVGEATTAKNSLNGFPIFGKPMKIHFADKRSKAVTYGK